MRQKQSSRPGKAGWWVLALLLLAGAALVVHISGLIGGDRGKNGEVSSTSGDRFAGFDDFYHARDGIWRLESTVHLLRERKFVSSQRELRDYLVYEANPGETVRLKQAAGRWKLLEVLDGENAGVAGWADVDKDRASRLPDNPTPGGPKPGA